MESTITPTWHGTDGEWQSLRSAAAHHCTCALTEIVLHPQLCPVHALFEDQQALDRLVFYRRLRDHLIAEEWTA
jgi:hypothetical protein